ncbi:MAG: ABC transporter permease [Saprospiraceae bacterium]
MIRQLLKSTWRNLQKNKLQSAINMTGLAVAIAMVLCIGLYIQYERSYDAFHVKNDRLYRIGFQSYEQGELAFESPEFTPPIGPACLAELSGVANYTRYSTPESGYISQGEKAVKVNELLYADSTFFDLFTFELIAGNKRHLLDIPYQVVLTASTARRLLGSTDVVGTIIQMNFDHELEVSGIVADPPENSSIQFNALVSFETLYKDPHNYLGWNGGMRYITFLELGPHITRASVEKQFPDFMWKHINQEYSQVNERFDAFLQPVATLHLWNNPESTTLRRNLYYLAAMALFMMVIACINFVNQATAQAAKRAREVGVRKTLGASRSNLTRQFIGETTLMIFIASLLGFLLAWEFLPVLPRLFGKSMPTGTLLSWQSAGILTGAMAITILGAGMYPSFFLASFKPVKSLKGDGRSSRHSGLRNVLVIVQFTTSMILIISTFIISRQIRFTENASLGFEKENILVIPLLGASSQDKLLPLETSIRQLPQVAAVAACSEPPGKGFTANGYLPEGMKDPMLIKVVDVDDGFIDLFGLQVVRGRALSREQPGDRQDYLINETLADRLHWEQPLGKFIERNGSHTVKGVVEDFHFASLHDPVEPLIITYAPGQDRYDNLIVKLRKGDLHQAVVAVQEAWKTVLPDVPMDHWFLDDAINQIYQTDRRLRLAITWSSALSILIALLGILGLTTFSVEQRIKEIGVRKVLGASTSSIVMLFARNYFWLVGAALLVAGPVTFIIMQKWLAGFAYRVGIPWWTFPAAGSLAFLFALMVVAYVSIKASWSHPAHSLRIE